MQSSVSLHQQIHYYNNMAKAKSPKSDTLFKIGERIKEYMDYANMTAKELANALGMAESSISLIVNAKTAPRVETLHLIAQALKIEDWQLFTDKILISQEEVEKRIYPINPDFIALIKSGEKTYSASSIDEVRDVLDKLENKKEGE